MTDTSPHITSASSDISSVVAAMRNEWNDTRAQGIEHAYLQPAQDDVGEVGRHLARQDEASDQASDRLRLVVKFSEEAQAQTRVVHEQGEGSHQAASQVQNLVNRAREEARHAQAQVDQAMRALSAAGARCGMSTSTGALEGELRSIVSGRWQAEAKAMMAGMVAKELAWQVGPKVVAGLSERALSLEAGLELDEIAAVVREHHPVMRAQVEDAIKTVKKRLGIGEDR